MIVLTVYGIVLQVSRNGSHQDVAFVVRRAKKMLSNLARYVIYLTGSLFTG